MSFNEVSELKKEKHLLRAALLRLADAAEEFASSDPKMVGHRDSGAAFEEALTNARDVLEATK
jgi:hypothetical protein